VAREDASGDKRLVAYVAAKGGSEPGAAEMRAALGRDLPDYMVPSAFVFLDTLPLTRNGKVDRNALPAPDFDAQELGAYEAPRTVIEWVLAREFEQTLHTQPIGIHDNFFQLGGNSLSGVKLVERIRSTLCSSLPVTAIFQAPTIAQLVAWISSEDKQEHTPLILMRRGRDVPPLYCVHPGGGSITRYQELAASLTGALPVYGIQSRSMFQPSHQDDSIEEMANYYVDEIRRNQSRGPYYLLGWSMGGFVAVAMAARLEQLGATVAFLGLLDTQFVDEQASDQQATVLGCLRRFAIVEGRDIDSSLSEADLDHLGKISAELPSGRERYVYAALWGQERGFWRNISAELMNFIYSDRENALRMIRDLRLPRVDAPIHVWWAKETLALAGDVPIDWSASTRGAVHTEVVDVNHEQIVRDPRVHAQLRLILQSLRDGQADGDAEDILYAGSNLELARRS
jgi:thioesterase domain-containing protein